MDSGGAAQAKDFGYDLEPLVKVDPSVREHVVDIGIAGESVAHVFDVGAAEDFKLRIVDLRLGVVDHDSLAAEEKNPLHSGL